MCIKKKHVKSSHPLVVKKKIVRDTDGEDSETWFNGYGWFVDRQRPYIS